VLIPTAVAFGYFETLFALRDPMRIQREIARFKSLEMLLKQVGHSEHLYEIFTDATEDLFTQTSNAIQSGAGDESFLVNAFNDEFASSAVITHFRVCDLPFNGF
jgi:ubiquitin thioesterase protein OTUB1